LDRWVGFRYNLPYTLGWGKKIKKIKKGENNLT
jgi:hypothetical protein